MNSLPKNAIVEHNMSSRTILFVMSLLSIFLFTGCYTEPVRHLASDVALLKVGTSTKEDVLIYLGNPDDQQDLGGGMEKWLYEDTDTTLLEKTPVLGKHIGSPERRRAIVTFVNNIVTECIYSSSDEDDMDWSKDYSWQEKTK